MYGRCCRLRAWAEDSFLLFLTCLIVLGLKVVSKRARPSPCRATAMTLLPLHVPNQFVVVRDKLSLPQTSFVDAQSLLCTRPCGAISQLRKLHSQPQTMLQADTPYMSIERWAGSGCAFWQADFGLQASSGLADHYYYFLAGHPSRFVCV